MEEAGEFPETFIDPCRARRHFGDRLSGKEGGTRKRPVYEKLPLMRTDDPPLRFCRSLGSLDIALPPVCNWAKPEVRDTVVAEGY